MLKLKRLEQDWREFKAYKPGRRFQERYRQHHASNAKASALRRIGSWLLVVVFTGIGIVLVFIPGPAVVFFFLAAGIVATQSAAAARALDSLEMASRRALKTASRLWRRVRRVAKRRRGARR
jgi:Ni/Co efflux regulator RcnB